MNYPFELRPLKYGTDFLEPHIDKLTMELHHGKHTQAYTDNLNKLMQPYESFHKMTVDEILLNLDKLPESIRQGVKNNAGGVHNHAIFFDGMTRGGRPLIEGSLKDAINRTWGSFEEFVEKFKADALTVFGSGWLWLAKDSAGNLSLVKTLMQDTLLPLGLKEIVGIDVWEHAYYVKYHNRRAEYIDNWLQVVDWQRAQTLESEG